MGSRYTTTASNAAGTKGEYMPRPRNSSEIKINTKVPTMGPAKLFIPPMRTYMTSQRVARKLKVEVDKTIL